MCGDKILARLYLKVNYTNFFVSCIKWAGMGREILEYAWVNKGFALIRQSKYDEAIKAFDKAIELNPQYADPLSNKGVALYDQGKCDEAIKAFDEAIKLNPQDPIARYAKGLVLQKLGHSVEADAAFAKAKELGYPIG